MGSTGAGAGRLPVSATRQCVCGGWTRYIVCQYCGTTDPHAAASGMISMTPLVQRSPEEAAAHSAGTSTPTGYDGGGAHWEPGTQPASPSFEAGTHAAPPLPPTTFAEAQFGEAPSAAAAFASTADLPPASGAFSAPPADAPSAFTGPAFAKAPEAAEPVAYTEPIPGWSEAPVPAPPGWATAVPETYEPGGSAPAPVAGAFETAPAATAPATATPLPATEPAEPALPAGVSYPTPPSSYEMPAEVAAHAPAPVTEIVGKGKKTKAPKVETAGGAKRALPRWAVPAAVVVVVAGAGGAYLATSGGSDSDSAPIVVHHKTPTTAALAPGAVAPGAVAPAAVAPASRLASTAPTGYTAAAPGTPVTAAGLATADSVHRSTELAVAGVTSATVTTFTGPAGVKITVLTETAASAAQAAELATHARHLGFTVQASNGTTVFALHSLGNAAPVVTALTSWAAALKG